MTEKRFTIKEFSTLDAMSSLEVICDNGIELPQSTACDLLNALHEENEQLKHDASILVQSNKDYRVENDELKQQITNLYNMVKCDVDNEIEVYPKTLVEYLVNILKIIGDVE